jgi:hypothetical protein
MKETYSLVDQVADAFIAMKETIQLGRPSGWCFHYYERNNTAW